MNAGMLGMLPEMLGSALLLLLGFIAPTMEIVSSQSRDAGLVTEPQYHSLCRTCQGMIAVEHVSSCTITVLCHHSAS